MAAAAAAPADDAPPPPFTGFKRPIVDLAPCVADPGEEMALQVRGCGEIRTNLKADELHAPVLGPSNPWRVDTSARRNAFSGFLEETNINDHVFSREFHRNLPMQFEHWKDKRGAADPKRLRRELEEAKAQKGDDALSDGDDGGEEGGAAEAAGAVAERPRLALVKKREADEDEHIEGQNMYFEEDKKGNRKRRFEAMKPEVTTHLKELYDYQGRSVILTNPLKPYQGQCHCPKKLLHTYRGHNKGVQCLRWLPPLGHMFMSGGLDGKVKLWDTGNKREVVQTYVGHFRGIRDVNFDNTGERFISSAYDNFIRVWDTETGKVTGTFTNGSTPNVVKFHPSDDRRDQFFAGCADKMMHQFDLRTGRIVQSYDQHLGEINTITFVDKNRRIVTTSDDKTMRVWEMDLPVTIKHVMDPSMHSLPATTMHPSGEWFGVQSMDNQVLIYSATDKFKLNKKKRFTGHICAGYACEPGFSLDGRYVSSGNGEGELFIWSWGSTKIVKHFKCHDKVIISHLWHPAEPSKVLTSSWDAQIKLWD